MTDRNDIRAALACIPSDDRELWLRVGMALQSEFPGEDGLALFDEWSQRGETYDARAVRDTWRSFKPGKVSIGTLWFEAKARGFKGRAPDSESAAELERQRQDRAQRRALEEAQYRERADKAAREARRLWDGASASGRSAYLERKGVQAHGLRFLADGTALVPACNEAGELVNLQRIAPRVPTAAEEKRGMREKRFLPGGRKAGTWHMLGDPAGAPVLLLAEGYATAASVHEGCARPVAVAWDAGNLAKVAKALQALFPGARLLVAGDDDRGTEAGTGTNPGRKGAEAAARAVGGAAVFPMFPADASADLKDWNDLHKVAGLAAVHEQIEAGAAALRARTEAGQAEAGADVPAADTETPAPAPAAKRPRAKKAGADVPAHHPGGENAASGPPDPAAAVFDRFTINPEGVFYSDHDDGGRGRLLWVCSRLAVTARTRDADGDGWGYLLEFDDPTGKPRTWAMPARMLAGDGAEYRAALLGMGLRIAAGTKARNLLTQYLQTRQPAEVAQCVDRVGWHQAGGAFVLPRLTVQREPAPGDAAPERIVFQTEAASENPFKARGTADAWRQEVTALCDGNSRLTFAVCCAFAGPLLRAAGLDSGGFHLRGEHQTGKSTINLLAASVYGSPDFMQRWRATSNALESVASQHCDTLLILDDIGQVDPREAGECAYLLGNEAGKARSTRTGQARLRLKWKVLFLSTGEISLAAHMAEGGKRIRGGQQTRLADVPAEVAPGTVFEVLHGHEGGAAFSRHIKAVCGRQFGHAGIAWLRWCVDNADTLTDTTRQGIGQLVGQWVNDAAPGEVQTIGARFALVATAGELASAAGLTGWARGWATDAVKACFTAWLNAKPGGMGSSEEASMLSQVRRWLQLNGAGRCTWWHRALDDRAPDKGMRAGFRRLLTADGKPIKTDAQHQGEFGETMQPADAAEALVEHFIFPEVFDTELCEGIDPHAVRRLLRERGHLKPDKGRPFDCKPRLPGMGPTRCYCIGPSIFEGED